jgi:hypothetical protein
MFINELAEPTLLVIYPGRFQPFHKGHHAVYNWLTGKFGRNNVFITTSNKTDNLKSPFSFAEKAYFMQLTGVPADRIVQATSPYQIDSVLASGQVTVQNPDNTVVIFAVSEKDMAEDPRFSFAPKKDGTESFFQQLKDIKDTKSMKQHGYIMTVPTFDFAVLGKPATSASEIRAQYKVADEKTRQAIVKDLFGRYTAEAEQIMNSKLAPAPAPTGTQPVAEDAAGVGVVKGGRDPRYVMATTGDQNDVNASTPKKNLKAFNLAEEDIEETIRKLGSQYRLYSGKGKNLGTFPTRAGAEKHEREVQYFKHANEGVAEAWSQKYKSSINCSHPRGFSQKAHCAGKKKQDESVAMEMVCESCGMCETHGNVTEIKKGQKDSNGVTKCWPGKHAEGTKKGQNGGQVRNCVPNEGVAETKHQPQWTVEQHTNGHHNAFYIVRGHDRPREVWKDAQGRSDFKNRAAAEAKTAELNRQGMTEGKELAKKVKIVQGPDAGKTGWIREIKHGAFKGAAKSYYIDLDDGGQANNVPGTALRLVKDPAVAEGSLKEFAPVGSNDGNDGFSDDTLKLLAAQWYNGDEDPKVEQTLLAAGWEIGQDEGYDDEPGVFVVQAGDINGNSYMSWPADELRQGVAENWGEPLTGWHVVYARTGNKVSGTPNFDSRDSAQKYLMTKMSANHHNYRVAHADNLGTSAPTPMGGYL